MPKRKGPFGPREIWKIKLKEGITPAGKPENSIRALRRLGIERGMVKEMLVKERLKEGFSQEDAEAAAEMLLKRNYDLRRIK